MSNSGFNSGSGTGGSGIGGSGIGTTGNVTTGPGNSGTGFNAGSTSGSTSGSMGGGNTDFSTSGGFNTQSGTDAGICPHCGQSTGRSGLEQLLGRLGITDDMVNNLKGQFQNVDIDEYLNTARTYLKDGGTKAQAFAKDNPGKVAAGVAALALGAGLIYAAVNRDKA
jgi:hypothetical protein